MQPVALTHTFLTWSSHDLHDGATCTTRRHASTSFEANWETLSWLASAWSKRLDLDACPSPSHPAVGFEGQLINHRPHGFDAQTKKLPQWFWCPNHQIVTASFEAQTEKPKPSVLRPNREKLSPLVLRPNRRKPSQWFWGQTTDKPSTFVLKLNQETCAPHLYVHSANHTLHHPISRSSDHWVPDLCDHPRSSALGLLLLPQSSSLPAMPHLLHAHHEASKRISPHKTKINVKQPKCSKFKFKPQQVNDSSQSCQRTDHLVSHFLWRELKGRHAILIFTWIS
jgi:hypothetical protein